MATVNGWNNRIPNARGGIELNSENSTISISTDATATTVDIATGAAAKVATLGSTNGASSLALKYGTADFSLASATGNVMVALDTGEITYPLQPAFLAVRSATVNNVTGNGTLYSFICDTEKFDRNGDYNNGTGVFTAPVAGIYFFNTAATLVGCTVANTAQLRIVTTGELYANTMNRTPTNSNINLFLTAIANMAAGDTAHCVITSAGEAGDSDDLYGDGTAAGTTFGGYLVC